MTKRQPKMTEPAHSLMYVPGTLTEGKAFADTDSLYQSVKLYFKDEFNEKQVDLFPLTFHNRTSLLGDPRAQGKPLFYQGQFWAGWNTMPKQESPSKLALVPATTTPSITL